jgi:phytol kinase
VSWLQSFLARALPDFRTALMAAPLLFAYGAGAAALAGWLRARRGVRTPYTRKIFHFLIFTAACVLQVKAGLPYVMLFGGLVSLIVLFAVYRGEGFSFYEALARPTDRPHRTLFVMVPLVTTAAGGLLSNLLFPAFAHVGYLVGGWGDAVGEPVGTAVGRHRYTVPSLAGVPATRSLEGSSAVLLMGAAAATLALWAGGLPLGTAALAGACCGLAGAAVEAFSSHGLDNLTVQVVAAGVAWLILA